MKNNFFKYSAITSLVIGGMFMSSNVFAHGYVEKPKSRAYMCHKDENSGCGSIKYEPQSIEGPSGFPDKNSGPKDGEIASGSSGRFVELNQQTPSRWTKNDITAGGQNFNWHFTASHRTKNWRYYITKQNWNPNKPLTVDSFDPTPFCVIDGGIVPSPDVTHHCNVPSRTGYQIIYAVWEIGDTRNSFYQVIDVNFKNGTPTPAEVRNNVGNITP